MTFTVRLSFHMTARCLAFLLFAASMRPAAGEGPLRPDLLEIRTVYVLSMSGGMDQYLANRLTQGGRFRVVTNPEAADAIFTDRLGSEFEARWDELYPPPPEEKPKEEEKAPADGAPAPPSFGDAAPARVSSFARGKGNLFLVRRSTREVIWSAYRGVKNTGPSEMHRLAGSQADRLHADVRRLEKRMGAAPAVPSPAPGSPVGTPVPPAAPPTPAAPAAPPPPAAPAPTKDGQ